MGRFFKTDLKTGAAICAVLALFGPGFSHSQTATSTAPAGASATSTAPSNTVPLTPRADPCANHVIGEKQASWTSDNYMCEVRADLAIADQVPRGIPGGVSRRTQIPNGSIFTKITVYHDATRVYGLKFSYKLSADEDAPETDTAIIGGNSGTQSVIELTPDMRLHAIRPLFGPDPAKHYTTPVLIGLDIAYYKQNPLTSDFDADAAGPLSHDELIETRRFGARNVSGNRVRNLPKLTDGFDVHLVQVIRSIEACVSPMDRNGRIFSLGVTTGGMGPRQNPNAEFCPAASNRWTDQPLGPKKIDDGSSPVRDPYRFVRGETDPFEFASGVYTRLGQEVKATPGPAGSDSADSFRRAKYSEPDTLLLEFGDTAQFATGGRTDGAFNMFLVTDPAKLKRGPDTFDFAYERGRYFVGVKIESQFDSETQRMRSYATLTYDTTEPNGAYLNGRYGEARLSGTTDFVVKRDRRRNENRTQKLSNQTPMGVASNATGHDYVFRGHDFIEMNLADVSAGLKRPIFKQAGPFNFHIANSFNKLVSDGVIFLPTQITNATSVLTMLNSESEVGESVSRTIAADVNVKGFKAGHNFSQSQSRSLTRGANSSVGMATFEGFAYTLVLDKPAITVSDEFAIAMRELYNQTNEAFQNRLADEMISRFGTHFANAVIMGGLATTMTEISAQSYASKREDSQKNASNVGADLGKGGGNLSFEEEKKKINNQSTSSSIDKSVSFTRGGNGGRADSFSLSGDNHAPVYYDLRSIDNLVEPIVMSQVLINGIRDFETVRANAARTALRGAVERRVANLVPLKTESTRKPLYRLTILGLSCDHAGGDSLRGNALFLGKGPEAAGSIQLFGKLTIYVTEGENQTPHVLYNDPDKNRDLKCDNSINPDFNLAAPIFTWALSGTPPWMSINSELIEDDDDVTDGNDPIDGDAIAEALPQMAKGVYRIPISGAMLPADKIGPQGRWQKPKVYLNFEWERLE